MVWKDTTTEINGHVSKTKKKKKKKKKSQTHINRE